MTFTASTSNRSRAKWLLVLATFGCDSGRAFNMPGMTGGGTAGTGNGSSGGGEGGRAPGNVSAESGAGGTGAISDGGNNAETGGNTSGTDAGGTDAGGTGSGNTSGVDSAGGGAGGSAAGSSNGGVDSGGSSGAGGAGGSESDPCEGLPASQCECIEEDVTTCGEEYGSLGVCGERALTCQSDHLWPARATCEPELEEVCDDDGADENCNGDVNEGCDCTDDETRACGQDGDALETCEAGEWGRCTCPEDEPLDIDANTVPDREENLVVNGTFVEDLVDWVQSEATNTFDTDPYLWNGTDAAAAQCSGSMRLRSTENAGDVFASQCVATGAGDYLGGVQVVLDGGSSGNHDPYVARFELRTYATPDCSGAVLEEMIITEELETGGPWQTLTAQIVGQVGTAAVEITGRVVADPDEGLQSYASRAMLFDNFLLRED